MSDTVIRVENLSKKYIIGHQKRERYTALRDVLANKTKSVSQKFIPQLSKENYSLSLEEFWALKEVSFEIKQGDRLGVIGRNGAGKSTLLKILSRITEPTKGRIYVKGRVASLLEVGTGFHPELTGRENIYLNGAILGMSKVEINRKFDEIVAFAEVDRFLDTPVKRYSSGMYVRLAFAVAAHLEPEILLVDEVLAVGDAAFQKKCLGKMEEVGKGGRTVLFISHQMGMIAQLCNKALILNKGSLKNKGETRQIIADYLNEGNYNQNNEFNRNSSVTEGQYQDRDVYISQVSTLNEYGQSSSEFGHLEPIILKIVGNANRTNENYLLTIGVKDQQNRRVFSSQKTFEIQNNINLWQAKVLIPAHFLTPGYYSFLVTINLLKGYQIIDRLEDVCKFRITDMGSEFAMYEGSDYGCVFAQCEWELSF